VHSMDVGLEDKRLKKTESDLEKVRYTWAACVYVCVWGMRQTDPRRTPLAPHPALLPKEAVWAKPSSEIILLCAFSSAGKGCVLAVAARWARTAIDCERWAWQSVDEMVKGIRDSDAFTNTSKYSLDGYNYVPTRAEKKRWASEWAKAQRFSQGGTTKELTEKVKVEVGFFVPRARKPLPAVGPMRPCPDFRC